MNKGWIKLKRFWVENQKGEIMLNIIIEYKQIHWVNIKFWFFSQKDSQKKKDQKKAIKSKY